MKRYLYSPWALAMLAGVAFQVQAKVVSLTPNAIGGGVLPDGHAHISFTMANGNWTPLLYLPAKPAANARVDIRTSAQYGTRLDGSRTDLGVASLTLARNVDYSLEYRSGKWTFVGPAAARMNPKSSGATIPDNPAPITYYDVWDGNWEGSIGLPQVAADGSIVVVRSRATWGASVSPQGRLHASSARLGHGDAYTFSYRKAMGGWVVENAPVRRLRAREIVNGIPNTGSSSTLVEMWDGNFTRSIRLPASAGDRDRITVRSRATWHGRIDNASIDFPGTMTVRRGDEYQFMYVAERGTWTLISSPQTFFQAMNVAGGILPATRHPRMVVNLADANWVPVLTLPQQRREGDRVIVKTAAMYPVTVRNEQGGFPQLTSGETAAFVVDANGTWQQETRTIDLLLLYSDKAATLRGESAMRTRLTESLGMTNDALENSRANFRFRAVANRKLASPDSWQTLNHALGGLRSHAEAQRWRNELKADGIYYDGHESGCGLAFVRGRAETMLASGSIHCGTTVMRHELGHNMGLPHSARLTHPGTIMNGNSKHYFAAPHLYSSLGLSLTPAGGRNEVAQMNAYSATVASFR